MKYSANYDKYPFVQVSYNSDDCISGWFAITDSISERLKVLEKPLKVVAIECYQGVFENDIRNAFAGRELPGTRYHRKRHRHGIGYLPSGGVRHFHGHMHIVRAVRRPAVNDGGNLITERKAEHGF